jgi:hypothetical protein
MATAAITPEIQARLYHEADARFAAKTGVTRKLDPKNAIDAKQIPVWTHIYQDVLAQYKNGTLVWTFDHPAVAPVLAQAQTMTTAAATGLDIAQKTADAQAAQAAMSDAHAALAGAAGLTQLARGLVNTLTAAESPVAAAVAQGVADVALAQKAHEAAQDTAHAVSTGQVTAQNTSDVVAATQGQAAASHVTGGAASAAGATDVASAHGAPKLGVKQALGFVGACAFLGIAALIASKHDKPRRRRSWRGTRSTTVRDVRRMLVRLAPPRFT